MKKPVEFWVMWGMEGYERICSWHRTIDVAKRAAKKCKRASGTPHRIVKVQEVIGYAK